VPQSPLLEAAGAEQNLLEKSMQTAPRGQQDRRPANTEKEAEDLGPSGFLRRIQRRGQRRRTHVSTGSPHGRAVPSGVENVFIGVPAAKEKKAKESA
jgi:hypothetical protein